MPGWWSGSPARGTGPGMFSMYRKLCFCNVFSDLKLFKYFPPSHPTLSQQPACGDHFNCCAEHLSDKEARFSVLGSTGLGFGMAVKQQPIFSGTRRVIMLRSAFSVVVHHSNVGAVQKPSQLKARSHKSIYYQQAGRNHFEASSIQQTYHQQRQKMNRNIHTAQYRPVVFYRFTQTVVCSFTAGSISEGLAGTLCKLSWVGHAGRMDTGSSGLVWLNSKSHQTSGWASQVPGGHSSTMTNELIRPDKMP